MNSNVLKVRLERVARAAAVLLLLLAAAFSNAANPDGGTGEPWISESGAGEKVVNLYFFWSRLCPHCQEALPFVERLSRDYDWLRVYSYQLVDEPLNIQRYLDLAEIVGEVANSVPAFIFCGRMETGYLDDSTTGRLLLEALTACHANATGRAPVEESGASAAAVSLPLLGDIDAARLGLPLFTIVIAGLDAFNPCAFFVLLFLLSLLVHARERARIVIIGGIFVLTSGLVYFAFMAAWLNVFRYLGEIRLVTLAAGILAATLALINIKDYFRFREGVSLSIPDSAKPALFSRVRGLVTSRGYPAMVGGAVVLALAANSYELLCTAGLPMIYTRILTLNGVSDTASWLYLALYNLIYVIPLAAIVAVFAKTLGSRKLSEREGRILKLGSGFMMLSLGVILIAAPAWLSNPLVALGALAAAGLLTLAVVSVSGWRKKGRQRAP